MPLSYPLGTLGEHRACRSTAAVFDVSHLGTVTVVGGEAFDRLQSVLTNDLTKIGPGRAQYTHLLGDDASVLDDIIVWWVADDRFDVMANSSNTSGCWPLSGAGTWTPSRAVLAVQGPQARARLGTVFPEAGGVGRFRVGTVSLLGVDCTVAGTGYTGEDGVELAVPRRRRPGGVGRRGRRRDHPRRSRGARHLAPGGRLSPPRSASSVLASRPSQAGLAGCGWDKETFRGQDALAAEAAEGPSRLLRGLVLEGRRPPRAGQAVVVDGAPAGTVTSGNFSPTLERGIALAFVPPDLAVGSRVAIDQRGTLAPATIVTTPFVTSAAAA